MLSACSAVYASGVSFACILLCVLVCVGVYLCVYVLCVFCVCAVDTVATVASVGFVVVDAHVSRQKWTPVEAEASVVTKQTGL